MEEGVIYDEDTKRILEQIAEDRKLYNKGTDIDGAEIFKSERGTDARTSAVNGKEYSSNKDNEKTKRIYDPGKDVKYKLKDISDIFDEQSKDDVLAELLEVEKENRDIKALNDGLRAEIQATKDWKINPARVEEAVRTVKEAYESKVKIPEIASRVQEIFERLQENIESENFEQIYAESYMDLAQIGEKIAENAKGAQDTTLFDQYADLRKMVRDTSIRLSAQDRADVGDYNAFRKRNFGRMRLSQNTGMDVDSFYEELASEYPEWFDKEITHPADRLMRIEKVLDAIKPTVSGMSTEDTGRAIAAELLERLSKTSPSDDQTIVDHLKKGYVKYYRDKNEQVRTEYREKLEKYKNKIKDRYDRETLLRLVNEFSKMREDVGRYGLSEIMKGEELEAFYFEDIDLSALEEDFSADTQDDELAKEKADKIVTDLAQRMLTASEMENGVTLDEKKAEVREKIKQAHERQAEKKKEYLDKI